MSAPSLLAIGLVGAALLYAVYCNIRYLVAVLGALRFVRAGHSIGYIVDLALFRLTSAATRVAPNGEAAHRRVALRMRSGLQATAIALAVVFAVIAFGALRSD